MKAKAKPQEEAVRVRVRDGAGIYRQGQWWRAGQLVFVGSRDAAHLIRRELADPA